MRSLICLLFLLILPVIGYSQVKKDSELFITLKTEDSLLFEKGFNQCDLDYFELKITTDLKFFHDQSGILDRKKFLENTRKNLCSNMRRKPIRKVKPESLEVFPLYNNGVLYGAIQKGVHNFFIRVSGKEDRWTSIAKFTHVWVLENDIWKLSQVLSYDHQSPN